jgi:hypothetical protein
MAAGGTTPASTAGERILTDEEIEKLSSDSEGGPARRVGGWLGWLTAGVSFLVAAMALYWTQFSITTTVYRASFLSLCLALIFILYPLARPGRTVSRRRAVRASRSWWWRSSPSPWSPMFCTTPTRCSRCSGARASDTASAGR